ncbi:MAG: SMODS domain-containing nucleotidyltransferase [Brachybacterium tyrofermentans]
MDGVALLMPRTVPEGFNELRSRLHLTETQKETAKTRTAALKSFLESELNLATKPVVVGSFARDTIVRPERDIDLLVPLNYSQYKNTAAGDDSQALLYHVRNKLNDRYASTKVSSQQVAVKLDFTDITVDVVPGFPRQGGGYLVADGSSGWQATNPPFHKMHMSDASAISGFKLKVIVRLMKYWNFVNDRHLSSLHVELMVEKMWRDRDLSDVYISSLLTSTLRSMPSWLSNRFDDPWPDGGYIDDYLSTSDRQTAINLLNSDKRAAAAAEEFRRSGDDCAAYERWGVVFRHNFPVYS